MELLKNTFFINLEERKDRLDHVLKEFEKLNIQGERINAVKTQTGAVGCSLSHIKCLELAKERDYDQIFICEDDITFLDPKLLIENLGKFKEAMDEKRFDSLLVKKTIHGIVNSAHENGWDVIIIGGNNGPPSTKLGDCCRRVYNCQTTTGYIVKKHYYDVLIKNMKEGVQQLLKNPENKQQYALDIHWKILQHNDNWFMIIPPTVIQYNNYSDIEKANTDYKHLMLDMDKEWLFSKQQPPTKPYNPEIKMSQLPEPVFHNMTFFCGK
jgi:glycosyl transferase family 25